MIFNNSLLTPFYLHNLCVAKGQISAPGDHKTKDFPFNELGPCIIFLASGKLLHLSLKRKEKIR